MTDAGLTYDIHAAREVLRRLELAITRRLDGLLQGDYRGLVPGHGSEPGEARQYVPGDAVRRIDWNVTARTQSPHVRVTIADRELETWILVDQSPSLDFGTTKMEKRDLALAATAAIGFLTAKVGNRFGAVIVDGHSIAQLPARQGRSHLMGVLHRVQNAPRRGAVAASSGTSADLTAGIRRLAGPGHRRGLAVVVSDLLGPQTWQNELRRLSLLHDALVIEIVDPRELELPDVGLLTLVDPETGQVREVNTRDRKLRQRYADAARAQREQNSRSVRECGADHLVLRTDSDWLLDIVRYVALRRKRLEVTPAR